MKINRDITGLELYKIILGQEERHYKNFRITKGYKEIYPTYDIIQVHWQEYNQITIKPRLLGGSLMWKKKDERE